MKPSDDLKKEVYTGKDCQTVEQICKECFMSASTVRDHAKKMVRAGVWKEVTVKAAYRGFQKAYVKVK